MYASFSFNAQRFVFTYFLLYWEAFVYTFTSEEYEALRKKRWYKVTNGAWNNSGINHPKNIGYLMHHIGTLRPKIYSEWEEYFYKEIASKEKLLCYADKFKSFVLKDEAICNSFDYLSLSAETYYNMVTCRLIYETWLGYFAEVATGKILTKRLKNFGYQIELRPLSPENDNKYAVDYLLYYSDKLICGVQVKSCNYHKSKQNIVKQTIIENENKNRLFTSIFRVPVHYVYYKRPDDQHVGYSLIDSDDSISAIIKRINGLARPLIG